MVDASMDGVVHVSRSSCFLLVAVSILLWGVHVGGEGCTGHFGAGAGGQRLYEGQIRSPLPLGPK